MGGFGQALAEKERNIGRMEGEVTFAIRMVKKGKLTPQEAAEELDKTIEEIDALLGQLDEGKG